MHQIRRSCAILLILALALSLLSVLPVRASDSSSEAPLYQKTVDRVVYDVYADHAVLVNGKKAQGALQIPSEIDGRPVTRIENEAFYQNPAITSVTVPDTVVELGDLAFAECEALESIDFGHTLERLPYCVCFFSRSLHTVVLPPNLREIGQEAFRYCFALTNLELPSSLTKIGEQAFMHTNVHQLLFPTGIEEIGPYAFWDNYVKMVYLSPVFRYDNLLSLIDNPVEPFPITEHFLIYHRGTPVETYINMLTEEFGNGTRSFALPDGGRLFMTKTGVYQLENGEMTLIFFPASDYEGQDVVEPYVNGYPVTTVGAHAFQHAEDTDPSTEHIAPIVMPHTDLLAPILLPPTVKTISESAFSDLGQAISVYIPDSVTEIHPLAFDGLASVTIYGTAGSEAERFAKAHGDTFVAAEVNMLPFTDVRQGAWYYPSVFYAYFNGVMNGVSSTRFAPTQPMSRAMLVQVLYNLSGSPSEDAGFADVAEGSWYYDAVCWAAANGIVNGKSPTRFAPNDPVTRQQAVTILQRYAAGFGPAEGSEDALSGFEDESAVSAYARPAMCWAVETGLIAGTTPTTLSPNSPMTRAQIATVLMRFLQQMKDPQTRSPALLPGLQNAVPLDA